MPIPQEALDLEDRSLGEKNWEPTLAEAYEILKGLWQNGDRDRELGLHLMFLSWYGLIEPDYFTGFSDTDETKRELEQMFTEVHAYFEPHIYQDAEMLYVVGLIADLYWFMLNDSETWEKRSIEYRKSYRAIIPKGIDPTIFLNRGAYGDYFAGQAEVVDGY